MYEYKCRTINTKTNNIKCSFTKMQYSPDSQFSPVKPVVQSQR